MAGERIPGPLSQIDRPIDVDDGTLPRTEMPTAGPIGIQLRNGGIDRARSAARDEANVLSIVAAPASLSLGSALTPSVNTKDVVAKTYADCGYFNWDIAWVTSATSGYIVQEIIEHRYVHTCAAGYPYDPSTRHSHYWEAWRITDSGAAVPGGIYDDRWYTKAVYNTDGVWRTIGKVYWVANLDPAAGFTENFAGLSGALLATTTQPTNLGTPLLIRQAGGQWKCCDTDKKHYPFPDIDMK